MVEKDYPAQHSTDSSWYAIDECGHLAAFFTSESGALPKEAVEISPYEEPEDDSFFWHRDDRLAIESISADHVGRLAETFKGDHCEMRMALGGVFFILQKLPRKLRAHLLDKKTHPANDPIVQVVGDRVVVGYFGFGEAAAKFHKTIHDLGLCIACTNSFHIRASRVGKNGDLVFSYDHPSANGAAWPYFLQHAPQEVKTIDGLSISEADKKELRSGIVVEGCFRDRMFWQPADSLECSFYSETEPISSPNDLLHTLFGYW